MTASILLDRVLEATTRFVTCVALVAVLGLTGGRMSLHTAAAASPCAGPFPSLDAQTAFGGTRYEDRGSTLSVAPLTAHPVIWQFALSLPPRHGEHAGDTYYGYAHATPSPAGTRLCSSAPASFVPADPYAGHPPHAVALRLDGVVDATHLTAHVRITVAGRTIAINEGDPGVPPAQARAAARAMAILVATLNARRWAAAFAMLDPQTRRQLDEKTYADMFDHLFVSISADGRGVPRSAHVGDALMASAGARAGYIQRVRVRLRHPNGGQYVHRGVVELILLRGTWYLGATDDWTR